MYIFQTLPKNISANIVTIQLLCAHKNNTTPPLLPFLNEQKQTQNKMFSQHLMWISGLSAVSYFGWCAETVKTAVWFEFLFSQLWKQWPAFIIIFVVTTDWWWIVLAYYSACLHLSSFRAEFQFYWHLSHQFSLRKTNKTNFILHESWWILRNTTICLAVSMWKTKQCTHMSTIGKSLRC